MFIEIYIMTKKYFFFEIFFCHPVAKGFQKGNFQLTYQYVSPPWCISRKTAKKVSRQK
jgi:hypothetical protein